MTDIVRRVLAEIDREQRGEYWYDLRLREKREASEKETREAKQSV